MEPKSVPNIFMSLYRLARHNNYDINKWRDILTGIHRKSKEKHKIKDLCLLYYSLFKGYTNKDLSTMEFVYKDRNTKEELGPLSIRDIGDAYMDRVSDLMKYMNSKQLAMISKFLLMMNRLNEPLCNIILSKISSNNLKLTNRSFFNIILSLSESNHVNNETLENVLIQNKELLYNMNRIDLMYLLKSISIKNIKNEIILNIILDKLEYYSQDMKPEELLNTLHSIYILNWYNEPILKTLFFRIQNLLDRFNTSSLVTICKYLSHFNLKDIKDFFDLQLIPLVHERVENQLNIADCMDITNNTDKSNINIKKEKNKIKKINNKIEKTIKEENLMEIKGNKDFIIDEILLFYNYCLRTGTTSFPKLVGSLLEELREDYQWHLLFSIFYKYQINSNYSSNYLNTLIKMYRNNEINTFLKDENSIGSFITNYNINTSSSESWRSQNETSDYLNLVLKAINLFKIFINKNDFSQNYLSSVVKYIIDCGFDNEEVILEILEKTEKSGESYSFDYLVDIMFNLHTFDSDLVNDVYNRLIKIVLEDKRSLNTTYFIPILCILYYRKIEIPSEFINLFKSIFVNNEVQDIPWQVLTIEGSKNVDKLLNIATSNGSNSIDSNSGTKNMYEINENNTSNNKYKNIRHLINISDEILEYLLHTMVFPNQNDLKTNKHMFMDFKLEICSIFKMIKKFRKEHLLNALLYYIGKIDVNLLKSLLEGRPLNYTDLTIDIVKIDNIPYPLSNKFKQMDCILIKIDDNIIFNPCYLVSGTTEVYYFDSSREKWDSISRNAVRVILHQNDYNTHKI